MKYGDVDVNNPSTQIPAGTRPLFDYWMRDPHICIGRDGCYYLSGTTCPPGAPRPPAWVISDGARLWKSPDLVHWEELGLVWSLDQGAEWMRNYYVYAPDGNRLVTPEQFRDTPPPRDVPVKRAFWGPKIHYSRRHDNYFIVGCMNFNMGTPGDQWLGDLFGGTFILRSRSGQAQGPYELTTDCPLTNYIDAKLFEEDDEVYFVWQHGNVARLNDKLDGLLEVSHHWEKPFNPEPAREGVHLFKHEGRYHMVVTIWSWEMDGGYTYRHHGHNQGALASYDAVIATSPHLHGPYGERYTSITGGGHGNPFQDRSGNWWGCVFICGHEKIATKQVTFKERPALVPMRWVDGRIYPDPSR